MNRTLEQVKWAYVVYAGGASIAGEHVMDPGEWLEEEYLALGWSVSIEVAYEFMGIWLEDTQLEEYLRRHFAPEVVDEHMAP